MDRLEEALRCALTYLLFHKGDEFVTDNVDYYREVLGHDGKPREVRICRYCGWEGGGSLGAESQDTVNTRVDGSVDGWVLF